MTEMKRLVNISGSTMVEVSNDTFSIVGYTTERIKRDFPLGSRRKLELSEIEDVMNTPGGDVLFHENLLLIKDPKIREHLGLGQIDEFNLTRDQIREILASGNDTKLEETLQFCPDYVLDKIVQEAISMSITSFSTAGLIQAYSGMDVLEALKEKSEDKPGANQGEDKTRLAQARKPLKG